MPQPPSDADIAAAMEIGDRAMAFVQERQKYDRARLAVDRPGPYRIVIAGSPRWGATNHTEEGHLRVALVNLMEATDRNPEDFVFMFSDYKDDEGNPVGANGMARRFVIELGLPYESYPVATYGDTRTAYQQILERVPRVCLTFAKDWFEPAAVGARMVAEAGITVIDEGAATDQAHHPLLDKDTPR